MVGFGEMRRARDVAAKALGPGYVLTVRMNVGKPHELVVEKGDLQSVFVVTAPAERRLFPMVRQWAESIRMSVEMVN